MPCDPGRVRNVLMWCMITGSGDQQYRDGRAYCFAGATQNNEITVLSGVYLCVERHDEGALGACQECHRDSPGTVLRIAREIAGLGAELVAKNLMARSGLLTTDRTGDVPTGSCKIRILDEVYCHEGVTQHGCIEAARLVGGFCEWEENGKCK
jgi:hypothetical protein